MYQAVLSGGRYAGKTAILSALREKSYEIAPEVTTLLDAAIAQHLNGRTVREFRRTHNETYRLMWRKAFYLLQSEIDHKSPDLLFIERGVHEKEVFAALYNRNPDPELPNLIARTSYDRVFMLETLSCFEEDGHSSMSTMDSSVQASQSFVQAYEKCGIPITSVPEFTKDKQENIEKRINFILRQVSLVTS